VRAVTLLPAATEIVAALGGAGSLVGISHECDYPAWVQHLPRVTTTPVDIDASGGAIDAEVRRLHREGQPVIGIDAAILQALAPDLIITQGLCEVCAVSDGEAHRLAAAVDSNPRVLSLTARDISGIWADIYAVGAALELDEEANELVLGLQARLRRLQASAPIARGRVLCIEWLEPVYLAGHWVPELVAAGGGVDIGARAGGHSIRSEWEALSRLQPDHILVMLCGFETWRARRELDQLDARDALKLMDRTPTWILDGNAYTSRPGPRVVDGAARIRSALAGRPAPGVERWQPGRSA
jgi:iron complex transport system substrate-binding protein